MGIWLGWDNIAQIISDSQTSTTSPATPSRTRALSIPPTATPAAAIPLTPTEVLTASPTPIPTNTPTPRYTTKHGKALPLIDTDILEDTIVSLVNDVRLMDNLESLVRVSSLDDLATAHSRHMADSQQAKARPLETGCGGSGTHIVQWPQVKSFSYRGPAAAPTTTTPTEYNETAKETAAGVVGYIHEGDVPYTKDPHYRYVGVGVVQSPDELGFMVFWITMYVADCVAEAPAATSTATATPPPSPTPIATVPPTVTNTPTATDTPSPTPTPTQTAASFSLGGFTNGRWLEQQDPQLAFAIRNLGWVRDGIDERESEVIQDLLYIAVTSRSVVASIVSLGWVQDGIHDVEAGAVRWLDNMGSAEVASSVVSLGWVEDGIEEIEVKAIEEISYIANADTDVASSIVSLAWMQDGIDMLEAGAIYWMRNIGSAEVASSVVSLAWMQDGIDDVEVKTIEELSYIANRDAGVGLSVVSLGWVQDGIDMLEAGAIYWMRNIGSAEVASSVVSLAWMQDGIDDVEVKTIEELSYIANRDAGVGLSVVSLGWVQDGIDMLEAGAIYWMRNIGSAEVASSVVSLAWMQDGIDDVEVKTIEELSYIANRDAGVGLSVVSLGWVQDGIDMLEAGAIYWMRNIGRVEVASSVVSLTWMQDGIDDVEVKTIEKLSYIANRDAGSALRIVGMPFLETIEPPDISAMESLRQLAAFKPSAFVSVMSHKALRDGISNDLAPIVATLDGVAETNPSLIDILLDPSRVLLERRIITLPLAGDVVLSIVRTGPGAARSMDLLEHAVRSVEEYMDAPFPTSYVGLLYENAVFGSNAGTNFGTHIAILPEYDVDDGSHEAEFAGSAIAHEVTHYYWSGNADWVDEGAADLMASIVEGARTGRPVGVTNPPCAYARTIAELESLGISRVDVEFGFNYSLGERLFVDLRRTLGDERFRQGFRALYLASELEDAADDRRGTSVGIEHIREAFRSDDGAESAVIARWYDGTVPYDLSRLDPGPVDPGLPGIDGRIDDAYIITSQAGPPVSAFSARDVTDWVYVTLEYSYNLSGGTREVPLEIVEYYEDGFEFSRRSAGLTAEARYTGGTSWFPVGVPPPRKWAPGRYVVYVYTGDRKLAEVEYQVTP